MSTALGVAAPLVDCDDSVAKRSDDDKSKSVSVAAGPTVSGADEITRIERERSELNEWFRSQRWQQTRRPYTAADVVNLISPLRNKPSGINKQSILKRQTHQVIQQSRNKDSSDIETDKEPGKKSDDDTSARKTESLSDLPIKKLIERKRRREDVFGPIYRMEHAETDESKLVDYHRTFKLLMRL